MHISFRNSRKCALSLSLSYFPQHTIIKPSSICGVIVITWCYIQYITYQSWNSSRINKHDWHFLFHALSKKNTLSHTNDKEINNKKKEEKITHDSIRACTFSLFPTVSFFLKKTEILQTEILLIKRWSPHRDVRTHTQRGSNVSLLRPHFVFLLSSRFIFPVALRNVRHLGLHTSPKVVRLNPRRELPRYKKRISHLTKYSLAQTLTV